eukprot:g53.t1
MSLSARFPSGETREQAEARLQEAAINAGALSSAAQQSVASATAINTAQHHDWQMESSTIMGRRPAAAVPAVLADCNAGGGGAVGAAVGTKNGAGASDSGSGSRSGTGSFSSSRFPPSETAAQATERLRRSADELFQQHATDTVAAPQPPADESVPVCIAQPRQPPSVAFHGTAAPARAPALVPVAATATRSDDGASSLADRFPPNESREAAMQRAKLQANQAQHATATGAGAAVAKAADSAPVGADHTEAVANVVQVALQLAEYWKTHPGNNAVITASITRTHRLLAAELVSLMSSC